MRIFRSDLATRHLHATLSGPHMLAFLPALCLAAYWLGGEILLIGFALVTPLAFAVIGGFGKAQTVPVSRAETSPTPEEVARDFLQIAQHNGQTTACFQIRVSGLSDIAQALGDEAAQDARNLVKQRLKSSLRSGDYVFSTSDNRFVVFLAPGFRLRLDGLLDIGKRLSQAVEEPLSVSGTTQFLFAAVGIASSLNFPRNTTEQTWRASAMQALNEATSAGPAATRVWSDKLSEAQKLRQTLRDDVGAALTHGQIQAYFQPQVSLRTGAVDGMEALARWDHPKLGLIRPSAFLCALSDSGEMAHLGKTMLAQSLSALQSWDDAGLNVPTISVNFSALELRNPTLADDVKWELDRLGLLAHRLRIDLPATLTHGFDDATRSSLSRLDAMGCLFDLDDFGQADLSLSHLQNLPIARVKIHQTLVRGASQSSDTQKLLKAAVALASNMQWDVLAEAVETVEEHNLLHRLGCQYAQGHLFAEPLALDQTVVWLRNAAHQTADNDTQSIRRIK